MTLNPTALHHIAAVEKLTGVTLRTMQVREKKAHHVLARSLLWWRLAVQEGWSAPRCASLTGHKDHTTVLHAIQKMAVRYGLPTGLLELREMHAHTGAQIPRCACCGQPTMTDIQ